MRWSLVPLLLICSLAYASGVVVKDVYLPEPPPGQTMGVMYLRVSNPQEQLALVAAATPVAARVEFHRHVHTNGQMKMQALAQVELPAHSETVFEPGGLHLMLFGLKRALKAGDEVPVTLSLSDGSQLQAVGRVRDLRR